MAQQKKNRSRGGTATRAKVPKRTKAAKDEPVILPTIGAEGDVCAECGNPLATDQRYCLSCGQRRGGPRVEFDKHLENPGPDARIANGAVAAHPPPRSADWTPRNAAVSIAALGVMLLVGVLIGRDDEPQQVASQEPIVIEGGTSASGTEATTASESPGKDAGKEARGNEPPPASSAEGAQTIDPASLEGQSSEEYSEQSKNLPDVIALPGEPPPKDNKAPGGGSKGVTID